MSSVIRTTSLLVTGEGYGDEEAVVLAEDAMVLCPAIDLGIMGEDSV